MRRRGSVYGTLDSSGESSGDAATTNYAVLERAHNARGQDRLDAWEYSGTSRQWAEIEQRLLQYGVRLVHRMDDPERGTSTRKLVGVSARNFRRLEPCILSEARCKARIDVITDPLAREHESYELTIPLKRTPIRIINTSCIGRALFLAFGALIAFYRLNELVNPEPERPWLLLTGLTHQV